MVVKKHHILMIMYLKNYCVFKITFYPPVDEQYFQSISPNPFIVTYSQPVNLTFLVAITSDGINNDVESLLTAFHYDVPGGQFIARRLSSQLFTLELGRAGQITAGNYTIGSYACTFESAKCLTVYILI